MKFKFRVLILYFFTVILTFSEYNRIVIVSPSMFEVACLLGVEDKVVGIGTLGNSLPYPENKSSKIEKIGNAFKPSIEKIYSLNPDLIIIKDRVQLPEKEFIKKGIKVVNYKTRSIDDIFYNFQDFSKLVNKEKEAQIIIENSREELEKIKRKEKQKIKGGIIYSLSPLMVFSDKSLPGEILNILGVENIGKNLSADKPIINLEFLLKENPDFLIGTMTIQSKEEIKQTLPLLEHIKAGKEDNIFIYNAENLYINSPRIVESIKELESILEKIE